MQFRDSVFNIFRCNFWIFIIFNSRKRFGVQVPVDFFSRCLNFNVLRFFMIVKHPGDCDKKPQKNHTEATSFWNGKKTYVWVRSPGLTENISRRRIPQNDYSFDENILPPVVKRYSLVTKWPTCMELYTVPHPRKLPTLHEIIGRSLPPAGHVYILCNFLSSS